MNLENLLKTNKTKMNALTNARLEHEQETAAQDLAARIMPFLKMPSTQDIAANPWLGGASTVLQSLLAAKLMKNVSEEKKRNRLKSIDLLNREEESSKAEKELLQDLVRKNLARSDEEFEMKKEKNKADISKIFQDIAESKARPTLDLLKEKKKEDSEELKNKIANQLKQVESFKKSASPEIYQNMISEAGSGNFDATNYKPKSKNIFDYIPLLDKTLGTGKDRYEKAKRASTSDDDNYQILRQVNKRTGQERTIRVKV